ncbi:hypothetical protein [Nocardia jiangxiensis]|uniref:DUF8175 domain-containing protein n=1 Tax=Nocardia jiangxiensis TaxID=282685 RepID=A0ABW6S631_9NOCA|nr:hypothetical protein [Nocardia jiangxiensis]
MKDKDADSDRGISFGGIASAAVLALIVVVGVFMYVNHGGSHSGGGGGTAAPGAPSPAAGSSDATGFAAPAVDVFGRRVDVPNNPAGQVLPQDPGKEHRASDQDWLTAAPTGITAQHGWQRVFGASVPFSTSDGPTRIADGLATGYSHTPQGAVLAAAQITYRLNARPADRDLYVHQVKASAQQLAAYDKARSAGRLPQQQPEQVTRYLVAPDAFQIENYADDMAIVRLAARGPTNDGKQLWAAVRLVMVWDNGDWRLKPTDASGSQTEYVDSLDGWTKW